MDGSGYCYCLDTYKKGDLEGAANVNVLTCSRLDGLVDGTDGLRYHASIPLYAGEKKLGVMNVASPAWRGLCSEDLQLLNTVGDLLSASPSSGRGSSSGAPGSAPSRSATGWRARSTTPSPRTSPPRGSRSNRPRPSWKPTPTPKGSARPWAAPSR